MGLGLPVDLMDPVVREAVDNPAVFTTREDRNRWDAEAHLGRLSAQLSRSRREKVQAHNARLAGAAATPAVSASSDGALDHTAAAPGVSDGAQTICAHCGAVSAERGAHKKCGNCKAVHYCSAGCQRAHWKCGHRQICRAAGYLAAP